MQAAQDSQIKAAASKNQIVDFIDNGDEKTVNQTALDSDSQYNPWNPDELYQKEGSYQIYEDMLKDDQIAVCMAVKKDLILGSGYSITCEDDGHSDIKWDLEIALTEDIESSFDDCLADMLKAYEIGFSISEKQFKRRDDGKLTLKNIKTRNPVSWLLHQDKFGNVVRYEQQGAGAKEFSDIDRNSLIHFVNNPRYGNPYGTSDLRAAYTAYFIKKQIVRFYAIFLEKAASPVPVAKYDRNLGLATEIQKVHDTIKKLQASSAMTIPKDFEIEFLQTTGTGEAYFRGINMFNMFIGRALLVPDLLGFQGGETGGGSYSLGQEQIKIFFKHITRRRRTIENLVNHHIIKPLVMWNYGMVEKFPKFKLNPIEEDRAEANAKLWLEAIKSPYVKPTLEEINHFKRIIDFPQTEAEDLETHGDRIDNEDEKTGVQDGNVTNLVEEKSSVEKTDDAKAQADKFTKVYNFPIGDYHKKTNFAAIERQLDSNLDLFIAKSIPIIKEIFSKFFAKMREMNITTTTKLEKLDKLALPVASLKRLEKLLDSSLIKGFDESRQMAAGEIMKNKFAIQPAPEFLKTLEEEDYNFIRDWEYNITKRARTEIIAALKDGRPMSSVIEILEGDGVDQALASTNRYARTKFTEVMNKGRMEFFKSTGVVGAYQFAAVLDDVTSDICAGLHGKIFKAGTEPVPPMHFNCRSVLVPLTNFEDWTPDTEVGTMNIEDFIDENIGKGFSRS